MIITLQDSRLLDWAAERLKCRWSGDAKTIALCEGPEVLAVCVFDDFTQHNCLMHIASSSPKWGQRGFIRACFRYAFEQLGLERVTFIVNAVNEEVVRLAIRIGGKPEGRLRRYFGTSDAMVFGMLHEECQWIRKDNGKVHPLRAATA